MAKDPQSTLHICREKHHLTLKENVISAEKLIDVNLNLGKEFLNENQLCLIMCNINNYSA